MSVRIGMVHTVTVPRDVPVAIATNGGTEVSVWPGGLGFGPSMQMSVEDWRQLRDGVDAAIAAGGIKNGQQRLEDYAACEGHNGDEDE